MTGADRRPQVPRTARLSALVLFAAIPGALLLAGMSPVQAQGAAAAAQVPFPQRHAVAAPGPLPLAAYAQLKWHLVGPFRGGWTTMVAGVAGSPDTFYFAAAGGGVWKTTDAGRVWRPVGNGLPPAIGAIAVAPSAPETIYVGTGHVTPRYDSGSGRGVFKSTDGGRTWRPLGLAKTHNIGRIWVDPHNADDVVVAALGDFFGPNPERGIYRSSDGGETWAHVLAIDNDTGVVDLAADPAHSNVLYAAAWQARVHPWRDDLEPLGDPGSGIYRSTDGGATWTRLSGGGWPQGPLGRIGLAVTHTAQGTRIYATVASKTQGGVWRSDDGGDHWQRVSADSQTFGNGYFSRLTVDPRNPDVVYSAGRSIRRSGDGGKTWTLLEGAPGGDHFLWINPEHPDHWITATAHGAAVTVDDGRTWSSRDNQPTGQFYHVAADGRFPYRIYSGGTLGIASRGDSTALTFRDGHPVVEDEPDELLPDPDDPNRVFGSGRGGRVSRFDLSTGQVANVSPWPVESESARPTTVKYRYGPVTPLAFTPTKPRALLAGAQVLFQSTDGGDHWQTISPDLTGEQPSAEGCDGRVSGERARACGYGVISTLAPSPKSAGLIWVGTDSGLIQLTRDDGQHWQNVTPPTLRPWEKVSAIDASPLDPATAYAAVDAHRQDDFHPHVFRTHDYGKTWKEIDAGLPAGEAVPVVRADTVRRGLLYAGTSEGVYVSMDDGDHWQSLQQNLPRARVDDLRVHGDDLIAATQGRAIWVLDDVTPLRQLSAAVLAAPAHLFAPQVAWRVHSGDHRGRPLSLGTAAARSPPAGAMIDYWLGEGARGPVTLEIYSFTGQLVRRFAADEAPEPVQAKRPTYRLSAAPGMHRFVWNLRYARPRVAAFGHGMEAVPGEKTQAAVEGPFVLPGIYSVVLTAGGKRYRAPLVVQLDPRVQTSNTDLRALLTYSQSLCAALERASTLYEAQKPASDALDALAHRLTSSGHAQPSLLPTVESLDAAVAKRDTALRTIGGRISDLEADAESADLAPTAADQEVFAETSKALDQAAHAWDETRSALRKLNASLRHAHLPPIPLPD